ncbi:MAG TPA: threonine/serine dehydratase [Acetobacteraceae bacterium]|nr:threonine/serine dehydratase [Acetobacteraceae bacterium]
MRQPGPEDVLAAARRLAGRVVRTPVLNHAALDRLTGAHVLLKAEPLQRTGSFKLRGATHAVLQLGEEGRRRGVVTHSSGNHGQALACAAASFGVPATIVMPADAPRIKVESTRDWGATILPYDRRTGDREALSAAEAARTGAALIPPYDHPDVIAGQGTLALELAEEAAAGGRRLDLLLVPAGGGGLIAGCALAMQAVSPGTRLIAVEPEGWDDTGRSLRAGERVGGSGGGSLLCDALLTPLPGALTFAVNRARLSGAVTVGDEAVLAAMAFAFRALKLVVEPGGAVALAALLVGGVAAAQGLSVGVVLSGGNADPAVFRRALGSE